LKKGGSPSKKPRFITGRSSESEHTIQSRISGPPKGKRERNKKRRRRRPSNGLPQRGAPVQPDPLISGGWRDSKKKVKVGPLLLWLQSRRNPNDG